MKIIFLDIIFCQVVNLKLPSGGYTTVREIAVNPKKNAPEKPFIVPIVEFYSNASHQNDFQIGRHPAQISPNLSNLSIGAPKLLKKLVWGTKCTRVVIKIT